MKTKKMFSKVLAAALAVLMLVGMIPVFASASSYTDEGSYSDGPVALKKTATLEDDGTYTINLEAFTTGTISTIVEKTNKPTDIVLVIDQSGSMANSMSGLPSGSYSEVTSLTNAEAYAGTYYYDVDGVKYPVTVKYATVGEVEYYVDIEGNKHSEDEVSWTWYSPDADKTYNAYGPYLTDSLVTLVRINHGPLTKYYHYKGSDGWEGEYNFTTSVFQARERVRENYSNKTVEFDNGGNDKGAYVGAAYTQLTPVYAHTYEYYYTNANGDLVALPAVGTSNDSQCPYTLYQVGTTSSQRLNVLTYALENFVASVEADAKANNIEHRIAIVGFANEEGNKANNTEILTGVEITDSTDVPVNSTNYYPNGIGHNGVQYGASGYAAATATALQSAITDAGKANIQTAIDSLTADGGTHADLGMQMAEDILSARSDKSRDSVVVFFTDGAPGSSSFDDQVAAETIKIAKELKNGYKCGSITGNSEGAVLDTTQPLGYTSSVYAIAVVDGADPYGTANIQGSGATQINEFMHMVSSNYPKARGENQKSRGWEFFREQGSMTAGYYMVADNAASLANVFKTVTNNIHQTQAEIDLGSTAVLKDVLADGFTANEAQITVKKVPYQGDGTWGTATDITGNVVIEKTDSVINITGYDYTANVVTNAAKDDGTYGAKLLVTVKGILAKDNAVTGTDVFTNAAESGIYGTIEGETTLVEAFDRPVTSIGKKTYVLDYAKDATLNDLGVTAEGVDAASDMILNDKTHWTNPSVANYGELSIADGQTIYSPKTMQWDGYDSFYVFGKDAASANAWTKVSVLPANNVYYEDTFITTSTDGTTKTGTVGIIYGGDWTVAEEGSNQENANNPIHGGWVEDDTGLSDDTGYSDGTVAESSAKSATATFTFTGTGFDIYSRTNTKTGTIMVKVVPDAATAELGVKTQYMIIDNLAESGDYYQIPTVNYTGHFTDADGNLINGIYGTYTVTVTVTDAAEGRTTYYLDGIKIYNPMNPDNMDDTVVGEYGSEIGADFQSVREFLLDSNSIVDDPSTEIDEKTAINGIVFIDRIMMGDTDGDKTNELAVYDSYGPKNEVYLGVDQGIVFNIGSPYTDIQVGLKAPEGTTTAVVTVATADGSGSAQGEQAITHSTDLFYTVTSDANGYVTIKNKGYTDDEGNVLDNILSVTKIKWPAAAESELAVASLDGMLLAADEFDAMPVVAYSLRASAPETEEPTEPETPTEPSGPNVEIENPEEPVEPEQPDIDAIQEQIKQFVTSLFNAFRGWFGR